MVEPYFWLVTAHVVLFAYWLGGDFGVYVCSRYVVRPDLPITERERFLDALMAIWSEDEEIVCIHPTGQRMDGHAAIRESWRSIFESNPRFSVHIRSKVRPGLAGARNDSWKPCPAECRYLMQSARLSSLPRLKASM